MRPRWSVIALGAALLLCAATSAEAGIVAPALGGLGGSWWSGVPAVMVGSPDCPVPIRVAGLGLMSWVTGEAWDASVEEFSAGGPAARWDVGRSAGWAGWEVHDALDTGPAWREQFAAADAAPEFGRLLAEADLGPALAPGVSAPQACDLGSVRAVVLDLAAGAELEEVFAESSLPRKAPEPISVLVWVFLGLTWVGVRAMRRVRNAEFGRGLTGRRNLVRRQRWSDETRAAIRRVIESGSPR